MEKFINNRLNVTGPKNYTIITSNEIIAGNGSYKFMQDLVLLVMPK